MQIENLLLLAIGIWIDKSNAAPIPPFFEMVSQGRMIVPTSSDSSMMGLFKSSAIAKNNPKKIAGNFAAPPEKAILGAFKENRIEDFMVQRMLWKDFEEIRHKMPASDGINYFP
jgi:hypothetical protein